MQAELDNDASVLSLAVLGGGHWGPHLIRHFYDSAITTVKWVVEPRLERRQVLAARFPGVTFVAESPEVLADPAVEAVVIATPTETHYELVRLALVAGKHVLVEKPLTEDPKTARALCDLAAGKRLVLMVGHVFLFNPAVIEAKGLIDSGELGEIYYASMLRTNLGPVRTDVDAGWDLASHDVAIANYWLDATPVSVSCRGGSWLNEGIDDAVFATLDYPGGVLVHVHASWLHPRKSRDLVVVGSRRMLTVNDMDLTEPLRIYDKGVEDRSEVLHDTFASFRASIREGSIIIPNVSLGEPLKAECDEFVRRLRGGGSRTSDGWAGLEVVRAVQAMSLSARRGGTRVTTSEVD
jgi:predicted dehydrogenase